MLTTNYTKEFKQIYFGQNVKSKAKSTPEVIGEILLKKLKKQSENNDEEDFFIEEIKKDTQNTIIKKHIPNKKNFKSEKNLFSPKIKNFFSDFKQLFLKVTEHLKIKLSESPSYLVSTYIV